MRRGAMVRLGATLGCVALVASVIESCNSGPPGPPALHQYTVSYDFTIRPDQAPPHAREDVHYSITVLDRKTRRCTVYESRPGVCRDYPDSQRCGYYDFLRFERAHQDDPEFIALT